MVTIEDIANEAGVSATTVSNVIHGRTSKASAQTVALINEIIQKAFVCQSMIFNILKK